MNRKIPKIGNVTPYPYQWEAIQAIIEHIRQQWRKPDKVIDPAIFEGYVSCGKTIILGAIANHCVTNGAKVLILTRTGALVKQDAEECENMATKASIYSASLGIKSTQYNCVVGTEKTIANALDTDFSRNGFVPHVILIDEAHEVHWRDVLDYGQTKYAQIINHFKKLNPMVAIAGVTGTPYRGIESIIGPFWKTELEPKIDRKFLVENGYIVPTVFGFGHDDVNYDLSEFNPKGELGTEDFSSSELAAMAEKMDTTITHSIMREVMQIAESRNGVLVTCASQKHCEEAAQVLPVGSYGIVTQATPKKERARILDGAFNGSIKYVLQIGALTTGVNIPLWDTSVILRRIGSLTLLVQLLGRGMRLLKQCHIDAGYEKRDHLCLDYSGTMEAMHSMFEDPLIESAELERAKKEGQVKTCPDCGAINSEHARRCINTDLNGNRCEFFWSSKECPHCKAVNDTTARDCRKCGETLIDPNLALKGKHYTEADFKDVLSMDMRPTKNGGILVLINFADGDVAKMFFNPWSSNGAKGVWQHFVNTYVNGWQWRNKVMAMKSAEAVCKMKAMFNVPVKATHRINEKGKSVVHGVQFRSKRVMGGKVV